MLVAWRIGGTNKAASLLSQLAVDRLAAEDQKGDGEHNRPESRLVPMGIDI